MASSDAKNITTRAELVGNEWVINGEKYYISGAGDPRCKIMIVMVKTSPDASPQFQQSQILVPMGTPGLEIVGPMTVFGHDHAPRGHMHLKFNNCRVPADLMHADLQCSLGQSLVPGCPAWSRWPSPPPPRSPYPWR